MWDEEDQWAPLWKDVRRIAGLTLANPMAKPVHFLGALVLQAQEATTANVPTWNVIDGQQRITTLQLLMDAVSAVIGRSPPLRFRRLHGRTTRRDYRQRARSRHLNCCSRSNQLTFITTR